jgi:hypothetical protein
VGDALPYLTPADDAIRAGAWTTSDGDPATRMPLTEWLPAWDLSQELRLRRQVEIDVGRVYQDTGVPTTSRIGISVVFASEFEDEIHRSDLDPSRETDRIEIDARIPGEVLGATVTLSTYLVLRDPAPQTDRHIAHRRGSVLWSDSKKVRLYGDGSQFPITDVDFAEIGLDPAAPWFLEVGPELELPAMGSIQLLLNNRFPIVVEAARDNDPDRRDLAVVRSQLFADVGRTLTEFALAHDDIGEEWPDDSLGAILSTALTSRFRESIVDLRRLRTLDPSAWAAKASAAFGLLHEPLP